jgi:adenylate cyclase
MADSLPRTTADAPAPPQAGAVLPEHIPVVGRMTRPPAERPVYDTVDNIAEWLLKPPRQPDQAIATFDELVWRLLAAGMPLLRVTSHTGTLHPQFLGPTFTWWRDTAETVQVMIAHEVAEVIPPPNTT